MTFQGRYFLPLLFALYLTDLEEHLSLNGCDCAQFNDREFDGYINL